MSFDFYEDDHAGFLESLEGFNHPSTALLAQYFELPAEEIIEHGMGRIEFFADSTIDMSYEVLNQIEHLHKYPQHAAEFMPQVMKNLAEAKRRSEIYFTEDEKAGGSEVGALQIKVAALEKLLGERAAKQEVANEQA